MKKLIVIFVLFLYAGIASAQTEAETLEWLNAKKVEVKESKSHTVNYADEYKNELSIDALQITLKNTQGAFTNLKWSEIKDIKLKKYAFVTGVFIVSNRMQEGKNVFTELYMNTDIAPKYLKALKHMAMLKGAKLVDDDLFGN